MGKKVVTLRRWKNKSRDEQPAQSNQGGDTPPLQDQDGGISSASVKLERSPLQKWVFYSVAFVVVITLSATLGATLALITPLGSAIAPLGQGRTKDKPIDAGLPSADLWRNPSQYQISREMNILVMGIDPVPGVLDSSGEIFTGRSDTMLLLRVNPQDKSAKVLSIPRDTPVQIPGIGLTKISTANASGGPALATRVVSRNFSYVPIHRYISISNAAFRELVDQLGGVEVFVPQRMLYKDASQQLSIDLASGWQTLNGEQAEQFARFREPKPSGDLPRVQRQQALVKALLERLQNPTVLPRLPQMTRIMKKYVHTNLSLEEMLALVNFGMKLEQQNVQMVMLPGRFNYTGDEANSYWWADPIAQNRVMNEYFGLEVGVTSQKRSLSTFSIAIQNASGVPSLSQRVVNYLKNKGFANVYVVADWPDPQRQTQIIVQRGNQAVATNFKQVLGFGNIEATSTGDLTSDITIRVGKDLSAVKKF